MKLRNVLPMLAVATFALTSCASKVTYKEFHEKAVEAAKKAKEVSFSKVVFDGYYEDEGKKEELKNIEIKFDKGEFAPKSEMSLSEGYMNEVAVAMILQMITADVIPEDEEGKTTYYAGSSFKVVSEEDGKKYTAEWNQYGLLTSMKGDGSEYTVKYSK